MPNYDGFPIHVQIPEVKFEVAVYELLRSEPNIFASRLLYYRIPLQHVDPRPDRPKDIMGRRLLVFERAEGEKNIWRHLSLEQRVSCVRYLFRSLPISFRPAFLPNLLVSAHHYSTSNSRSTSPLFGSANASSSRSPDRFLFPLHPRASSVLPFSRPRSKRQSGTSVT